MFTPGTPHRPETGEKSTADAVLVASNTPVSEGPRTVFVYKINSLDDLIRFGHLAHEILFAASDPNRLQVYGLLYSFCIAIGCDLSEATTSRMIGVKEEKIDSMESKFPALSQFPLQASDGVRIYFWGDRTASEGLCLLMTILIKCIKSRVLKSVTKIETDIEIYNYLYEALGISDPAAASPPQWFDDRYLNKLFDLFRDDNSLLFAIFKGIYDQGIVKMSFGDCLLSALNELRVEIIGSNRFSFCKTNGTRKVEKNHWGDLIINY